MTNNIFTASLFDDDWETAIEAVSTTKKNPEYFEFEDDPLALTCAMLRNNKHLVDIATTLVGVATSTVAFGASIESRDRRRADAIRSYFAKKHTVRRLKNEFVSEWMNEVDELCERKTKIKKETIPIVVTLPRFYEENLTLDKLMKVYKSAPTTYTLYTLPFEEELEFVEKVHRVSKRQNHLDYYWKTKNNHLVRFRTRTPDYGETAWDAITRKKKIRVKSANGKVSRIQGYEYWIFSLDCLTELEIL